MLRLLVDLLVPRSRKAKPAAPTVMPLEDSASAHGEEARLLAIFGLVNEWLCFAETKNGGLVAPDSIGVTGASS